MKTAYETLLRIIRALFFESSWDFLKAAVLAGLFFLWGNVLGLLYEPPRSLKVELNYMGDFFEGYGFIDLAFDTYSTDTNHNLPLSFEPHGLRKLRVCRPLYLKNTGRGVAYLRRVVDEYSKCIRLDVHNADGRSRATISRAENSHLLSHVMRDGLKHWFCECEERVLTTFEKDSNYP